MSNMSTLQKEQTSIESSSEPSTTIKHYTIAKTDPHDDSGILLFEQPAETRDEIQAIAEIFINLNLDKTFYIYRNGDFTEVTTYVDLDRTPFGQDDYNALLGIVTNQGEIHIKTMREFTYECSSPRRLSPCSNCINDYSDIGGTPCIWQTARQDQDNDIAAEDWVEILKKKKHPRLGEFNYVSPLYTKTLEGSESNGWQHYQTNNRKRGGFVPYLRPPEDHSFENIEELYERQSAGATTRSRIKTTCKDLCSICTLKTSCDSYHRIYGYRSKQYVLTCRSFTRITEKQLQTHYLKQISKINRKDLAFVTNYLGDLDWRHDRFKIFLKLSNSNKKGEGLVVNIRRTTYPSDQYIKQTLSIKEAVSYLKENLTKQHRDWTYHEPEKLSDKTAALLVMATDEITCSQRSWGGWTSGTTYPIKTVKPYNWGNRVELSFYASQGRDAPRWTHLEFESMFDIFKYYGNQYLPDIS